MLPWDPAFARFFCDLYTRRDRAARAGRAAADLRARQPGARHGAFREHTGLELRSGTEPEMSWLGDDVEVWSQPNVSPAYHIGALETMRPIVKRVIAYAQAMGLDMIEGDYEDTGQLELNFQFDRCERTCDRLVTYRQICAQVAREFGVIASFMPKPAVGVMANGCHHNLSLWRGERERLRRCGRTDAARQRDGAARARRDPRALARDARAGCTDGELLRAVLGRRAVRARPSSTGGSTTAPARCG